MIATASHCTRVLRKSFGRPSSTRCLSSMQCCNANFSDRLRARELLVGTLVAVDSPTVVEILSLAGFDWLFIDTEHAPLTSCLPSLLRAAGTCPCLVRIPCLEEAAVKNALDVGAAGIIAPQVNSVQQAKDLVRWAKYSPMGQRGIGGGLRAQAYGNQMEEYTKSANQNTVVVVQIEHIDAVNNCAEIAAVPGIDALFVGPYDLSSSLGVLGQVDHPTVVEAVDRVVQIAQERGKALGAFGIDAKGIEAFSSRGATLLTVGIDAMLLSGAARQLAADVRRMAS